jgi:hypothetical protein
MRLSEAFEINSELKERGVRYVVIGHKTEQSKRRVPLPASALPYLPRPSRDRYSIMARAPRRNGSIAS